VNLYVNKDLLIIHFGIGLIGTAVEQKFSSRDKFEKIKFPFSWDSDKIEFACNSLISKITEIRNNSNFEKTIIVWTAGKAGFSANEDQRNRELKDFKIIVSILKKNLQKANLPSSFILLSSAGGLFEGQRFVCEENETLPKRHYGHLKIAMENYLSKLNFERIFILRVSSVYSILNFEHRLGLISTLIKNALNNYTTFLSGDERTIRDYICDEDIAKYIFQISTDEIQPKGEIQFLISAQPKTIYQIKHKIEKMIGKKILVNYKTTNKNSLDMSFSKSLQAEGLSITNFDVNLQKTFLHLQKSSFRSSVN